MSQYLKVIRLLAHQCVGKNQSVTTKCSRFFGSSHNLWSHKERFQSQELVAYFYGRTERRSKVLGCRVVVVYTNECECTYTTMLNEYKVNKTERQCILFAEKLFIVLESCAG